MLMRTIIEQAFEAYLVLLGEELIDKHRSLGMKATGDWENSVEVEVGGTTGVIRANDYTEYLVQGRGPGNRPPISPLERWVKAKLGVTGKKATGIAFAVANKIAKEGTNYHPQGTDLVDGVLTEARIQQLYEELGQVVETTIAENLTRQIEKAFA